MTASSLTSGFVPATKPRLCIRAAKHHPLLPRGAPRDVDDSLVVGRADTTAEMVTADAAIGSPSLADDSAADQGRRRTLNVLALGAATVPSGFMAFPFLQALSPPKTEGPGGAVIARDINGVRVQQSSWLATHHAGDHSLVQGLKDDPYYLVVRTDDSLDDVGLNAVCTHMGCIVPWVAAENKFICPCHGSQYNTRGTVVRGPAPLPLALAHVDIQDDAVTLSQWTETDFRSNSEPWWN